MMLRLLLDRTLNCSLAWEIKKLILSASAIRAADLLLINQNFQIKPLRRLIFLITGDCGKTDENSAAAPTFDFRDPAKRPNIALTLVSFVS